MTPSRFTSAYRRFVRLEPGLQAVLLSSGLLLGLIGGMLQFFHNELEVQIRQLEQGVTVAVFLEDALPRERVQALRDQFSALPALARFEYISKEDAADNLKAEGTLPSTLWADQNPFPASFVMAPRDASLARLDALAKAVGSLEGVEEVVADRKKAALLDTVRFHQGLLERAFWIGTGLLLLGLAIRFWSAVSFSTGKDQFPVMAWQGWLGSLGAGVGWAVYQGLLAWQTVDWPGSALTPWQIAGMVGWVGLFTAAVGNLKSPKNYLTSLPLSDELPGGELDLDWHFKDVLTKDIEDLVSKP